MKERGVTEEEVEECLRSPDVTYPDGNGNVNAVKHGIRVVYRDDGHRKRVITVVRRGAFSPGSDRV
ncbi:MAG: DUF4258 domain-containing protein [Firmicutes bacterium]|nr:DUF4258 domain-containing protein [Alicyclobacillaceae bacterium]MCL6497425.1 DUF4258 domain-containing protein [Bacillota bacterium]